MVLKHEALKHRPNPLVAPTGHPACKGGSCMNPTRLRHAPHARAPDSQTACGKSQVMERRSFIEVTAGGLLAAPLVADAQQPAKVPRVGFLTAFSPSDFPLWREG